MTGKIKIGSVAGIAVLALMLGMRVPVCAQQQVSAGQQGSGTAGPNGMQPAQNPGRPQNAAEAQNAAHRHRTFGSELAHETREEVGEEKASKDEMVQFRESPSVRMIARWTGLSVRDAALASTLLNFAIVAGLILWACIKFVPGLFRNRTTAIQKAMQEAQQASEEARRRLAEIESRLSRLDTEIAAMRDAAEKEAAAEEQRIKEAAEEDGRKIVESAEQEISAAVKAARRDLTLYAADLAVGLAKKQIHVDAASDQVIVRSFANDLGSSGSNGKDSQ